MRKRLPEYVMTCVVAVFSYARGARDFGAKTHTEALGIGLVWAAALLVAALLVDFIDSRVFGSPSPDRTTSGERGE